MLGISAAYIYHLGRWLLHLLFVRLQCICILLSLQTAPLVFGRPFVKRFALCYRSVVLSVLSVTYCGQTVGRIKMKLGMQVGLGPGHTVLGGDPAPPPVKGHSPPIFGPYLHYNIVHNFAKC